MRPFAPLDCLQSFLAVVQRNRLSWPFGQIMATLGHGFSGRRTAQFYLGPVARQAWLNDFIYSSVRVFRGGG
jgi:hypothetical protein